MAGQRTPELTAAACRRRAETALQQLRDAAPEEPPRASNEGPFNRAAFANTDFTSATADTVLEAVCEPYGEATAWALLAVAAELAEIRRLLQKG